VAPDAPRRPGIPGGPDGPFCPAGPAGPAGPGCPLSPTDHDFQGVQHFRVGPVVYLQDQGLLAVLLLQLNQLDPGVQKRQQGQAILMVQDLRSLLQDPLDQDLPCCLRYLLVLVTRRDRADPANLLPLGSHWVPHRRGVPAVLHCLHYPGDRMIREVRQDQGAQVDLMAPVLLEGLQFLVCQRVLMVLGGLADHLVQQIQRGQIVQSVPCFQQALAGQVVQAEFLGILYPLENL